MSPRQQFNGSGKKYARDMMTTPDGQTYESALMLTGSSFMDVDQAIYGGVLSPTSHILIPEYNRAAANTIKRKAKARGLVNVQVLRDDIVRVDPTPILNNIEYVFLDFCGNCRPLTIKWLLETSRSWLNPWARIGMTFSAKAVYHIQSFSALVEVYGGSIPESTSDRLFRGRSNWTRMVSTPYERPGLDRKSCIQLQHAAVDNALPYEWMVDRSFYYCDKRTPMIFYHGYLNGRTNDECPGPLHEFLDKKLRDDDRRRTIRPAGYTAQQWARCLDNPNSPAGKKARRRSYVGAGS